VKEIDKGVTVEKTVTMGETHYRKLLAAEAERDRLRDAMRAARGWPYVSTTKNRRPS
jgi:hypothetical protein